MYIPKHFLSEDEEEAIGFMKQYSFATIITVKDNFQTASHLPFLVSKENDKIILTSHFAKANKQWPEIKDNSVLVVFSEPHAYVSPKHYDKEMSVPTWNYISVHAYGKGQVIEDDEKSFFLLEQMIDTYEADYKKQWVNLPTDYKLKMLNGIVMFQISVTDLQAKRKLSQNKNETERQRIIQSFSNSNNDNEKQIGFFMKQNENK